MTTIDKIRAEIERRIKSCDATSKTPNQLLWAELSALLPFLDTIEEPVSDDLEEAAGLYLDSHKPLTRYNWGDLMDSFKAGAEWQKVKMIEWLEGKVNLSYGVATDAFVEVIDKLNRYDTERTDQESQNGWR